MKPSLRSVVAFVGVFFALFIATPQPALSATQTLCTPAGGLYRHATADTAVVSRNGRVTGKVAGTKVWGAGKYMLKLSDGSGYVKYAELVRCGSSGSNPVAKVAGSVVSAVKQVGRVVERYNLDVKLATRVQRQRQYLAFCLRHQDLFRAQKMKCWMSSDKAMQFAGKLKRTSTPAKARRTARKYLNRLPKDLFSTTRRRLDVLIDRSIVGVEKSRSGSLRVALKRAESLADSPKIKYIDDFIISAWPDLTKVANKVRNQQSKIKGLDGDYRRFGECRNTPGQKKSATETGESGSNLNTISREMPFCENFDEKEFSFKLNKLESKLPMSGKSLNEEIASFKSDIRQDLQEAADSTATISGVTYMKKRAGYKPYAIFWDVLVDNIGAPSIDREILTVASLNKAGKNPCPAKKKQKFEECSSALVSAYNTLPYFQDAAKAGADEFRVCTSTDEGADNLQCARQAYMAMNERFNVLQSGHNESVAAWLRIIRNQLTSFGLLFALGLIIMVLWAIGRKSRKSNNKHPLDNLPF